MQSVQTVEWKQTNGKTDGQTDGHYFTLPSRLTRSVNNPCQRRHCAYSTARHHIGFAENSGLYLQLACELFSTAVGVFGLL